MHTHVKLVENKFCSSLLEELRTELFPTSHVICNLSHGNFLTSVTLKTPFSRYEVKSVRTILEDHVDTSALLLDSLTQLTCGVHCYIVSELKVH